MQKLVFLLISLFLFSCENNPVPKPKNLIEQDVMVDILYDAAILQAADGTMSQKLTENNIRVSSFIYNKYKIDSATYYENHRYYAADLSKYKKIYKKVISRLEEVNATMQAVDTEKKVVD